MSAIDSWWRELVADTKRDLFGVICIGAGLLAMGIGLVLALLHS